MRLPKEFVVEKNTWVQVIPPLIDRIDTTRLLVSKLINNLLVDIEQSHPQALTVATKEHERTLTYFGEASTHGLCRAHQSGMRAGRSFKIVLWRTKCRRYVEDFRASSCHDAERARDSERKSFIQAFGRDLSEAHEWLKRFRISGNIRDLNQAWDLYYHDLELAVPGSYVAEGFEDCLFQQILRGYNIETTSKKVNHPRLQWKDYLFLLKGYEDLRQDEEDV
ncbi:hypothetical protein JTB14_029229 [Gonioctena quinquepunctata]|nr:hypothetical protein JTB14_029229 [Gonioctena quinquepunctata]